jgi:hypothetical protein
MASLYEQLMAAKGAPKAAAAPNSTQLRKAPVSLRSAMRKYAAGGDVSDTAPDYSRAYGALGGAESVNNLRNQFLQSGIDENTIGSIFSKYYAPEPQQGMSPQAMTPPEPARYQPEMPRPEMETRRPEPRYQPETSQPQIGYNPYVLETRRPPPPEEPRYQPPQPPEKPIYEEPRLYEEPRRPERPDMPEIYPQDYAGIRTTGTSQPQETGTRTSYRINDDGSQTEIGYDGQPVANYTPEQWAMHNATTGVTPSEYRYVWNGEGYDKLPNGPQIGYSPYELETRRPEPRYEEPVAPEMPYEPETNVDPEEPPPQRVYDYGMVPQQGSGVSDALKSLMSRSSGQTSQGLSALIAKALASGSGSLEEQRRLMELLGSIKGK